MSSKKLKVSVGLDFTSDQMSIEKIREQIDTAASAVKINLDPESAKKFEMELRELGGLLEKHLNENTGKINAKNLVADLDNNDNFLMVEKLGQRYAEVGVNGQQSFRKVANEADFLNKKIGSSNKTLEKMGTTLMNTIRWNISSSVVNAVTGEFQKMYYFAKDLDRTLTDIRIVSGQSADQMERFALSANESAKALKISTIEYAQAATLFFQQGLGEADVRKMTDGAVMASRITGVAAADMADLLTSTMNGYKLSADEVMKVTDKLAAVGATTAADFHELSTGMSKVASMANTAGVSIDELTAQIATIVSVTRESPESIGTSLKTIYGRMLMFKTDTKALMKDDDGEVFGAPKVEEALQAYNRVAGAQISLFRTTEDGRRELRDLGEVIEEIGGSWDTVTDKTAKFGLATALAGSRQQNRLVALFDSWDMYKDAVETSLNAEGTTLAQNAIYMESYEGKLKGLQAAKEEMYMVLTDSDSMKFFVGALTEGVQLFTKLVDMAGGFSAVLGIVGVAFSDNLVKKAYEFQQAFTIPKEMKETGKDKEQIESLKELHAISKAFGADEANRYREDLRNKKAALKETTREVGLLEEKITLLEEIEETSKGDDSKAKKKAMIDIAMAAADARGVDIQSAEELRVKYNELAEAEQNLKELEQLSYGEVIGDQIHRDVEDAQAVVDGLESQIDSIHKKATEAASSGKKALKKIEGQTGDTSSEIAAKAKEAERLTIATQATRAAFMLLPAAIGGATDSSKSLNEVIKNIAMLSLPSIAIALQPVIASFGVAAGAVGAFSAAMLIPAGIIGGVTLATMALAAIIKEVKGDFRDAAEIAADMEQHQNAISANNENINRLKSLSSSYSEIRRKMDLQIELNEEEKEAVEELIRINPDLIRGYNDRGEAIIDTTQSISEMIEKFEQANELEDVKLLQGGKGLFKIAQKDADEYLEKIEDINRQISDIQKGDRNPFIKDDSGEYLRNYATSLKGLEERYEKLTEAQKEHVQGEELKRQIDYQREKLVELNSELRVYESNLSTASTEIQNTLFAQVRLSDSYAEMSTGVRGFAGDYIRTMDVMDYEDFIDMQMAVDSFMEALNNSEFSSKVEDYGKLANELKDGAITSKEFDEKVREMIETLLEIEGIPDDLITRFFKDSSDLEKIKEDIEETIPSLDDLANSYEEVTSKIQDYNVLLSELDSAEGLSVQSKQNMISKHQELLPYLDDEAELRKYLMDIISAEEETQRQAYINMIMMSEDYFNAKIKGNGELVGALGKYYTKDLENAKSLAEAKAIVEANLISGLSAAWAKYYRIAADGTISTTGGISKLYEQANRHGDTRAQAQINALRSEHSRVSKEMREIANIFDSFTVNIPMPDFGGINLANVKAPSKSSGKSGSGGSGSSSKPQTQTQAPLHDYDKDLQALESFLLKYIKKRGELEKKAIDDWYKKETEALDKIHKVKIDAYNEDLQKYKDVADEKIRLITDTYDEENYYEDLSKEKEEERRIQSGIDKLALDDSSRANDERRRLRELLAQQVEKIADMERSREKDLKVQAYKDAVTIKENEVKDLIDQENELYEDSKTKIEATKDIRLEVWEKSYDDAAVYAEASKAISSGLVKDFNGKMVSVKNAYVDFENRYGSGMGILGDKTKKEFLSTIDRVNLGMKGLMKEAGYLGTSVSNSMKAGNTAASNLSSGIGKVGTSARNATSEVKKLNAELSKAPSGTQTYAVGRNNQWLMSYDDGGKIDYTGMANVHGTASEPEYVFNYPQFRDLAKYIAHERNRMPAVATAGMGGMGQGIKIGNLIEIKGDVTHDVLPLLEKEVDKGIVKLRNMIEKQVGSPSRL